MFTGIVEATGRAVAFRPQAEAWELAVECPGIADGAALGESIAVNGCCLTLARAEPPFLRFDVLEETRRLTNLGDLRPGQAVNLERSLAWGGRIGGHFVTGHVDARGRIEALEPRGRDHYLRVAVPEGGSRYLVRKGSVAVDGVSLTVAEAGDGHFAAWLIPHTLAATNFRERKAEDAVNLEFDLLAKHVERLLAPVPA